MCSIGLLLRSFKWHQNHSILFGKAPRKWSRPRASDLQRFLRQLRSPLAKQFFQYLPLRCKELVYYWSKVYETDKITEEGCLDLSQCGLRMGPPKGIIACFTGTSMLWLIQRQRLVTGLETLGVQGMTEAFVPHIRDTPDNSLANFGGNSFSEACVSHALLTAGSA